MKIFNIWELSRRVWLFSDVQTIRAQKRERDCSVEDSAVWRVSQLSTLNYLVDIMKAYDTGSTRNIRCSGGNFHKIVPKNYEKKRPFEEFEHRSGRRILKFILRNKISWTWSFSSGWESDQGWTHLSTEIKFYITWKAKNMLIVSTSIHFSGRNTAHGFS
jgi:uncharacterized protein YktA (UPF0223 family)